MGYLLKREDFSYRHMLQILLVTYKTIKLLESAPVTANRSTDGKKRKKIQRKIACETFGKQRFI